MKIEQDTVELRSGVRFGETLGSPDHARRSRTATGRTGRRRCRPRRRGSRRAARGDASPSRPRRPRRASSSTTTTTCGTSSSARARARRPRGSPSAASRSACSRPFGIAVRGWVAEIGDIVANHAGMAPEEIFAARRGVRGARRRRGRRAPDHRARSTSARRRGDTLGGVVEVVATGLPPGLGSHVHWDRKLDGRLAHALMSIQAVKGVEIGLGFETARRPRLRGPRRDLLRRGQAASSCAAPTTPAAPRAA